MSVYLSEAANSFVVIQQAKVFSRWDSIKKAGKNYTIAATPDDKASVLQQVVPFFTYSIQSSDHLHLDFLTIFYLLSGWYACIQREAVVVCKKR